MSKRLISQDALQPARKRRRPTTRSREQKSRWFVRRDTSSTTHHSRKEAANQAKNDQIIPELAAADRLAPIDVTIRWDQARGGLDYLLDEAADNKVDVPTDTQRFPIDPRLYTDIGTLRDVIRRMYNCEAIGMDIKALQMKYGFIGNEKTMNVMLRPWDEALTAFADDQHIKFKFIVVFEPRDDRDANIFESEEAPPELRSFFDTKSDIGNAPEPRPYRTSKYLKRYYSGFDVRDENERRKWQRRLLASLSLNGQAATLQLDKLPSDLNGAQKTSISAAQESIHRNEIENESVKTEPKKRTSDPEYCVLQKAFSGTENRSGPPVNLCLQLLMASKQANGLYRSTLLESYVDSHFYHYQISGAVGIVLKLYGQIDAEVLLRKTGCLQHPQANEFREAAAALRDICLHGALLADETGFGKTKQALLAAVLHSFLYHERDANGHECHRPILLAMPPTLISQWLIKIRSHWPWLIPILAYEDAAFRSTMELATIPPRAMREISKSEFMPQRLKYLFDPQQPNARRAIIVTSYTTHRLRTGRVEHKHIPGESFAPPKYHKKSKKEILKVKPKVIDVWQTDHEGKYSLLIADEAQKVKNNSSDTWSVFCVHKFPKTILTTATPMFNAAQMSISPIRRNCLEDGESKLRLTHRTWSVLLIVEKIKQICAGDTDTDFPELDTTNPVRIEVMNTESLTKVFSRRSDVHLRVAARYQLLLDMVSIQRSQGSVLRTSLGEEIPLRLLFKKIIYKTATVKFQSAEELEYQLWHREAAKDYGNELMFTKRKAMTAPRGPIIKQQRPKFLGALTPLRKLGMAAFSTKMARLNAVMENIKSNTFVETLRVWRDKGLDAKIIRTLTRGEGEAYRGTADELISYLVAGSPAIRLILQEILNVKALERVNKAYYGHHQKLIVGEVLPANAFYLQEVLRACLIDARVFHADLSHQARSQMVELFNDPNSSLKCLIMLFDVGAVGLNLHKACNRVVIASLPRSRGQESQLAGRASRITSDFPLTVVRRFTPNSHDQFRSVRQAEKAALQLAANARDHCIRTLILKLLNEFQGAVDQCHQDPALESLRNAIKRNETKEYFQRRSAILNSADIPEHPIGPKGSFLEVEVAVPPAGQPVSSSDGQTIDYANPAAIALPLEEGDAEENRPFAENDDAECYNDFSDSASESGASRTDRDSKCYDDEYSDSEDYSDSEFEFDIDLDEEDEESDDEGADEEEADMDDDDIPEAELEMLLSECQPDDDTRHNVTLLKYAPDKVWTEEDLEDDMSMKLGLRLLYNKINNMDQLHIDKSIHIMYKQFPQSMIDRMSRVREATSHNKKKAKEQAL